MNTEINTSIDSCYIKHLTIEYGWSIWLNGLNIYLHYTFGGMELTIIAHEKTKSYTCRIRLILA